MLITFRSKACADVIMLSVHAEPILALMGKALKTELGTRGQIAPEQINSAIHRLEHAIGLPMHQDPEFDLEDAEQAEAAHEFVGVGRRAYPLLDMLRHAQQKGAGIAWD